MTYGDRLRKRWVVVRLSQGLRWVDVAWFYKYSDAVGYLQILKRIDPATRYDVVFEASKPEC